MTINAIDVTMATGAGGVLEKIPGATGVIWETNFASDGSYFYDNTTYGGLFNATAYPKGWTGVKASAGDNDSISGQPGAGVGGSVAMRFKYDETFAQPVLTLMKHLTDDQNTGYSEFYVRYHVKMPDTFRMGSASSFTPFTAPYWKWGRAWQNTAPVNPGQGSGFPGSWSENRLGSGYMVWNFGNGNPFLFGTQLQMTCQYSGATVPGSSGGERYRARYGSGSSYSPFPESPGAYWDSVGGGAWEMDFTDTGSGDGDFLNTPQDWHTLEWRVQLRNGATWGNYQVWFDGILQDPWEDMIAQGGAPAPWTSSPTYEVIETAPIAPGNGYNAYLLFDNMQDWNAEWDLVGVDGYIDVNDIVISTNRIGHTSEVAGQPGYIAQDDGSTPVPTL